MSKCEPRIALRFRDLIVEPEDTIREHREILREHKCVWWGWWMKQYEKIPREVFSELATRLEQKKHESIYLVDSGHGKFYRATVTGLAVAPPGRLISAPDPTFVPYYYQRGRYPAWFEFIAIGDDNLSDHSFSFSQFPTREDLPEPLQSLKGKKVDAFDDLRQTDVTLWLLTEES